MSEVCHKAAREWAELFAYREYASTTFRNLARAYLELSEQNKELVECIEFYADHCVWGNSCAAIDPCDTYTCDLGVLRGGKRAREVLERVRG